MRLCQCTGKIALGLAGTGRGRWAVHPFLLDCVRWVRLFKPRSYKNGKNSTCLMELLEGHSSSTPGQSRHDTLAGVGFTALGS